MTTLVENVPSFWSGAVAVVFILAAGWPVAIAAGVRPRIPGAWIAGLVLLYLAGFVCQISGSPLTLPMVAAFICVFSGLLWMFRRRERRDDLQAPDLLRIHLGAGASAALFVVVVIFAARAFLQPLEGADTSFRWELLARQILNERNFDFYPPRSPEHFTLYFYPDGMSPLTALTHWVVYAIKGSPDPAATYGPVLMTYVVILWLTLRLAFSFGGSSAARGAAYALVGTPLLLWAALQGQETGLTCLGIVGGIYYLLPKAGARGSEMLAALALSVAVLAREYGFALVGGVLLGALLDQRRIRWIAVLVPIALVGGSWYLRNYVLTGNPFYPLSFGGLFPVNAVHAGTLEACREVRGWGAIGLHGALKAVGHVVQIAFLPTVCTCLAVLLQIRRWLWLLPTFVAGLLLWVHSVNYTAGGIQYSYRVLSPLIPLGCLLAGVVFARLIESKPPLKFLSFAWPLIAVYGLVNSLTMPSMAKSVPPAQWLTQAFRSKERPSTTSHSQHNVGKVLSDNPYLHASVVRGARQLDVLPIWSPEVAFLFESNLSAKEKIRKLHDAGITRITANEPDSVWWPFFEDKQFFRAAFATWPRDASGYCIVPPMAGNDIGNLGAESILGIEPSQ
jgi:hypothetical protein